MRSRIAETIGTEWSTFNSHAMRGAVKADSGLVWIPPNLKGCLKTSCPEISLCNFELVTHFHGTKNSFYSHIHHTLKTFVSVADACGIKLVICRWDRRAFRRDYVCLGWCLPETYPMHPWFEILRKLFSSAFLLLYTISCSRRLSHELAILQHFSKRTKKSVKIICRCTV